MRFAEALCLAGGLSVSCPGLGMGQSTVNVVAPILSVQTRAASTAPSTPQGERCRAPQERVVGLMIFTLFGALVGLAVDAAIGLVQSDGMTLSGNTHAPLWGALVGFVLGMIALIRSCPS